MPALEPKDGNSRKIHNVFTAVKLTKKNISHSLAREENLHSFIFVEFMNASIENEFLCEGGVLIVDSCTIHLKNDCQLLKYSLWKTMHFRMIPLN